MVVPFEMSDLGVSATHKFSFFVESFTNLAGANFPVGPGSIVPASGTVTFDPANQRYTPAFDGFSSSALGGGSSETDGMTFNGAATDGEQGILQVNYDNQPVAGEASLAMTYVPPGADRTRMENTISAAQTDDSRGQTSAKKGQILLFKALVAREVQTNGITTAQGVVLDNLADGV
jgi:hypothetical protein